MKYVKQAIKRGAIPFVIMSGISLIMRAQNMEADQVRSTFIAGLVFTVVSATSVLYEVEAWSFKKQSIIHHFLMVLTVLPLLFWSGWFPTETPADILRLIAYFLLVGLVLWALFTFIFMVIVPKSKKPKTE